MGAEWFDFRRSLKHNSFDSYQAFLRSYPKGQQSDEIILRLHLLRARETLDFAGISGLLPKTANVALKNEIHCAKELALAFTSGNRDLLQRSISRCPSDHDIISYREYITALHSNPGLEQRLAAARTALEKGNIDGLLESILHIGPLHEKARLVDRLLAHYLHATTETANVLVKAPLDLKSAANYQYLSWMRTFRKVTLPATEPLASQLISGHWTRPSALQNKPKDQQLASQTEVTAALACLRISLLMRFREAMLSLTSNEVLRRLEGVSRGESLFAFQSNLLNSQLVMAPLGHLMMKHLDQAIHEIRDAYSTSPHYRARHELLRALERDDLRGHLAEMLQEEKSKWANFKAACSAEKDDDLRNRCKVFSVMSGP